MIQAFKMEMFTISKRLDILGLVSFGVNYSLIYKFKLVGQPEFWYQITKLVDAPISEHLFNDGVEIGIRRKIK